MKNKLMLAIFVAGVSKAFAGPIYSSSCEVASEIAVPKNGGGYFLSKDCKSLYVLPPTTGKMSVTGRTIGDISRCKEIGQFNKMLKTINGQMEKELRNSQSKEALQELIEKRKMILNEYAQLGDNSGALIELLFNNGIDENVRRFKDANDHLNLNIVPVQIKEASLSYNQSASFDPEVKIAFNQTIPLKDFSQSGVGSFSGRLDLSIVGACPLVDAFERTIPLNLRAEEVAGIITPNMQYKYEVGATYKYKARYNLSGLASKIRKVSSKGGLFKTSSTSSLIESAESSGWFSLEMSCDDSRVCDKAKEETAVQIKSRLIAEVLDQISLTKIGHVVRPVEASEPGKNGASTASEGLKKCPNGYCQAASVLLDVLSSSFGGSSKTDEYINKHNSWVEENVEKNEPVVFTGIMGFGK